MQRPRGGKEFGLFIEKNGSQCVWIRRNQAEGNQETERRGRQESVSAARGQHQKAFG